MGKKYDLKEIRKEKNEPRKTWQQTCAVSIIMEKGESLLNRSVVYVLWNGISMSPNLADLWSLLWVMGFLGSEC